MTIVAEYDFETNTMPHPARQTFRTVVAAVAAKARAKLPQAVNGRIESAVKLVLVHDVTPQEDGSIVVGSSTDPLKTYRLVGTTCECQDFTRGQAPDGWCQHRIAAGIAKRAQELMPQEPVAVPVGPMAGESVSVPEASAIPQEHLVVIQGRPFIKVAGLLALAHQRGLQSLRTVFTYNDPELALAEATAVFPFGTFTDVGDASPSNTNAKVRAHFRRVAATRATARALRQALNVSLVAVEELDGE